MINTIARSFYYPSLGYNVLLEKIGYTQWWNEVDITINNQPKTILLGALPFKSMLARMKAEGVKRVISLNEKHELKSGLLKLPQLDDYKAFDIERIEINVCDFTGAPSIEEIENCLEFIENSSGKIYVHCKAGRCRSALIVAAALVKFEGKGVKEAFQEIKRKRHHIVFHGIQWRRLEEFKQFCEKRIMDKTDNSLIE